jgi:hypothetical protein
MADLLQPVKESGFPLTDRLIHLLVKASNCAEPKFLQNWTFIIGRA